MKKPKLKTVLISVASGLGLALVMGVAAFFGVLYLLYRGMLQ